MGEEFIGDGSFRGIVMPCQMCLGGGELITLQGPPEMLLRSGGCPQCDGTGHIRIECARDEVEDILRGLPPSRMLTAIRQSLTGTGLCATCFGSGLLASVEVGPDRNPVRYLEAPCPACQDPTITGP